ncbi:tRNA guanosine(34) transglycosylase Tgt [bacterium]|nr:tRNA guanosine(34) transglycosylase Tgt [bacterium]
MFKYEILKKSKKSKARVGKIKTPHGEIITPAFIPVATFGVIKGGLDFEDMEKTKTQCQITNTFHFLDLDRVEEVKKLGGLHKFFNFSKPIFTDSGGFQVFSLGKGAEFGLGKIGSVFPEEGNQKTQRGNKLVKKITKKGVLFRSPRDGREIYLTPELSAKTQIKLGADFIYLFDVCGSPLDDFETAKKEMELSHHWFERFLNLKIPQNQQVFGIIQGGIYRELREISTKFVNDLPVFGIAIGGALGKSKIEMYKIISWINNHIDFQRPHHLLGIGDLEVLEKIIKLGIDLFDCALPTRIARHGTALTSKGYLNISKQRYISKKRYVNKFQPIEKGCKCFTCQNYSIAQINFLFKAKEQLAGRLLTIHNLYFLETQLEKIREKIEMGKF